MSLDVFVSWSGEKSASHQVALVFRDWIPRVLQSITCFVSSHDIDAGDIWLTQLLSALEEARCGILCITAEVMDKPWVAFEAGALVTKYDRNRVIPLLVGIDPGEMRFPFAALQCKTLTKEGVWDIIRCINSLPSRQALAEDVLRDTFEIWWPKLETQITAIQAGSKAKIPQRRTSDDKIDEILGLVRSLQRDDTPSLSEISSTFEMAGEKPAFLDRFIELISQRRPLIVHWAQSAALSRMDEQGVIHLYFSQKERHSFDSLRRDATMKFLAEITVSLGGKGIRLHMLPEQ